MDFFEILIVLLFIVLPLLQQVLGKREEPGAPDGLPEDDDAERLPGLDRDGPARRAGGPAADARAEQPGGAAASSGGWAADWGEWPEDHEMEAEGASIEALERDLPAESLSSEEAPRPTTPSSAAPQGYDDPARARAASRVVSLEKLHVDRAAEHARLHARPDRPAATVARGRPRLAALMDHPDDLRRAILLAEVVGPPAALRGPPGPPGIV